MAVQWRRNGGIFVVSIVASALVFLVCDDKERNPTTRSARWIGRIDGKVQQIEPRALLPSGVGDDSPVGKEHERGENVKETLEIGEEKTTPAEGDSEETTALKDESKQMLKVEDVTLAISLLGGVVLIMTLYYAVNYEDADMKYYVWSVISTFMSIFIAVFTFTSVKGLLESFLLDKTQEKDIRDVLLSFSQVALYFFFVQLSIPLIAGVWKPPFQGEQKEWTDKEIEKEKEKRTVNFKSVATLLAHTCAFAAIHFGGTLQHMSPFNGSKFLRFLVPPVMFVGQIIVGRLMRLIRLSQIERLKKNRSYEPLVNRDRDLNRSASTKEGGHQWSLDTWDQETYECEVEIASLSISFLLVQACRFSITDVMPDTMGVEEEDYYHPQSCVYQLLASGALFAVLCVCCVAAQLRLLPPKEQIQPGTGWSMFRRCLQISEKTFAVACAWCLLFSGRWQVAIWFAHFPPNGIISRVILAIATSGCTFFIVVMLDMLADHDATSDSVDEAIFALIGAFSFLVGFSWEQSFDGAVEVLVDDLFQEKYRVWGGLGLTVVVIIIVYPAWRKYILNKMLLLKQEREKKRSGEELSNGQKD